MQNSDDVNNMTWPPELGSADMQFLDGFVDETMDPSLSMLNPAVYDNSKSHTTSSGVDAFLPTSQAPQDTTPFWP